MNLVDFIWKRLYRDARSTKHKKKPVTIFCNYVASSHSWLSWYSAQKSSVPAVNRLQTVGTRNIPKAMPQFAADISGLIRNWGKRFYVFNYDRCWKLITKTMSDWLVHLFPGYFTKLIKPSRWDDKLNVKHFPRNYDIFTKVQYQLVALTLLYSTLILRHVSAWHFGHLQAVFCEICSVCFNLPI